MMNQKMRLIVLLISSICICLIGVYRLFTEPASFVPSLFALCGFVGTVGTFFDMKHKEQF